MLKHRKLLEAKQPMQQHMGLLHLAALGLAILIGFGLRIHQLGDDSLWVDEIGQVYVASLSLPEVLAGAMRHYGATPLDYVLLHFWIAAGTDDFWVRIPSVLYGTLAIAAIYKFGKTQFGHCEGLAAACLLSVSVFHTQYSQEVRFYALATLLTIFVMLAFTRAVSSNRMVVWVSYFIVALAGLYTYYFIAIVIGLQFATLLIGRIAVRSSTIGKKTAWYVAAGLFVVGLLFMPWVLYDLPNQTRHPFGPPLLSWATLTGAMPSLTGFTILQWGWYLFAGTFIAGAVRILLNVRRTPFLASPLAVALLTPGTILVIDSLFSYFFATRQLLYVLPTILTVTSYGITWIPTLIKHVTSGHKGSAQLAAVLIMILITALLGCGNLSRLNAYYASSKEDWRSVARFFQANLHPGDKIAAPLLFYVEHYYPEAQEYRMVITPSIKYNEVGHTLGNITRLWIISSPNYPHVDLGEDFSRWISESYGGYWEFQVSSFRISYTGPGVCQHKTLETLDVVITEDVQKVTCHCR
jgi:mannosyltransferase